MSRFARAAKAVDFIPIDGAGGTLSRFDGESLPTSSGSLFSDAGAMNISAVWRGVNALANTVAMLPLIVYRKTADGGREKALDHPLYQLLHRRPNPRMSSYKWRQTLMGHVLTRGNHYSEIQLDGANRPYAFWPLRPDSMTVERDRSNAIPSVRYRYRLPNGEEVTLPAERVLHIRGMGYDGVVGYSPITLMREALGIASAAERAQGSSFRNGARPGLVLTHPKSLSTDARTNLTASLRSFEGFTNTQRTMVLEEDIKPTSVGFSPADAQFLQTRQFQVTEFARWIGVPPHKLYDLTRSTNNNIEHQSLEYLGDSVNPWLVDIEQQLIIDFFPDDDEYPEFLRDAVMQTDSRARAEYYRTLWAIGAINADTITGKENLPRIPGGLGGTYFGPLNMAPLDQLAGATLKDRVDMFGALVRAGVQPDDAAQTTDLPAMEHTGLEPVTLSEQGDFSEKALRADVQQVQDTAHDLLQAAKLYRQEAQADRQTLHEALARPITVEVPPSQVTIAEGAVQVHPAAVTVEPAQVTVTIPDPKPVTKRIERDTAGRITSVTEE